MAVPLSSCNNKTLPTLVLCFLSLLLRPAEDPLLRWAMHMTAPTFPFSVSASAHFNVRSGLVVALSIGLSYLLLRRVHPLSPGQTVLKETQEVGASVEASLLRSVVLPYSPPVLSSVDSIRLTELLESAECREKEPLLRHLLATKTPVSRYYCNKLPTWNAVHLLYGPGPVVIGLETCQTYREKKKAMPRVAGLWNTGTSAATQNMILNFPQFPPQAPLAAVPPQAPLAAATVPWGKHTPLRLQYVNIYPPGNPDRPDDVMPIVLVRDPLRWMNTMCARSYGAKWERGGNNRCPNLLPNRQERDRPEFANMTTFVVNATNFQSYYNYSTYYPSLASVWSRWNRDYLDASFPRLILRMEDFIYYPEVMFDLIANCTGSSRVHPFRYHQGRSKRKSNSTLISAMMSYGSDVGRIAPSLTADELRYLQTELDPELMTLLHYRPIEQHDVEPSSE